MSIQDKINDIRRKPEHIRMRYVLGCTAFSMIFVLAIWVFSLISGRSGADNDPDPSQAELFQNLTDQKKSMEAAAGQMKDTLDVVKEKAQQEEIGGRVQSDQNYPADPISPDDQGAPTDSPYLPEGNEAPIGQ
jgi:hypothetical protein